MRLLYGGAFENQNGAWGLAQTGRSRQRGTWWALVATLLIGAVIAVLTLMPVAGGAPGSDKLYHVLAFAALAFPLSAVRMAHAPMVVVAVLIYGGAIELVQPFVGRSAEFADFGADAIGAALGAGAGIVVCWGRKRRARSLSGRSS